MTLTLLVQAEGTAPNHYTSAAVERLDNCRRRLREQL